MFFVHSHIYCNSLLRLNGLIITEFYEYVTARKYLRRSGQLNIFSWKRYGYLNQVKFVGCFY